MGARFRLKASFSVAGFCRNSQPYCRDAKAVLAEMQNYGLILADNGSNWYFQGSAYPAVARRAGVAAEGDTGQRLPGGRRVVPDGVSRNSGEAEAKPGCPIG